MNQRHFTERAYMTYAVVVGVMIGIGLVSQIAAFVVFLKPQFQKQHLNKLFINLIVSNLVMVVVCCPLVLASCINRGWLFGDAGCSISGFATGVANITTIVTLSYIMRQISSVVFKSTNSFVHTKKKQFFYITISWMYGLVCMLPTVTGWSSLVLEPGEVNCALRWTSSAPKDIIYMVLLIIVSYVLPVGSQIRDYVRIKRYIHDEGKQLSAVIARNRALAR